MIYDVIIVQQNIEIDVARSLIDDLFPAKLSLNTLEHVQKNKRRKSCFNLASVSHVIEVWE